MMALLSGRQDSNLRPPGPKPGALPACATSRTIFNCGGGGIRTRGTELPVRQFSKLLISATHPPHRLKPTVSGTAKLLKNLQSPKDLCN